MMTEWISLVGNLGFPIAITFYVLFRLETTVNKNTEAINKLLNIIQGLMQNK